MAINHIRVMQDTLKALEAWERGEDATKGLKQALKRLPAAIAAETAKVLPVRGPGTEFNDRFTDAMQLLCGGMRPEDRIVQDWFNGELDSAELQNFASTHGPSWGQGCVLIDAAYLMANTPEEGEDHK